MSDTEKMKIPDEAVEALARILADSALFDADCGGYGWNAETDSSDHFMPTARKKALRYLEAAAPHMLARPPLVQEFGPLDAAKYQPIGHGPAIP